MDSPKETGCATIVKALIGGVATIIAAIVAYIVAPIAVPLISGALTPTPAPKAPPVVSSPTSVAQRPSPTLIPQPIVTVTRATPPVVNPTATPPPLAATATQPPPAVTATRAPQSTPTAIPATPTRAAQPTATVSPPTPTVAPAACNAAPVNPQDNVTVTLNVATWYVIQEFNAQVNPQTHKFNAQTGAGTVTARATSGQRAWACPHEAAANAEADKKARALKAANPTYQVFGPDGKEVKP